MKVSTEMDKMNGMGKIENTITVGDHSKGGLNLMCRMYLDGEKVREFESDSFTMPFAYGLHQQMHRGPVNTMFQHNNGNINNYTSTEIDNIANESPARVVLNYNYADLLTDGDYVHIVNAVGMPQINGIHRVRRKDDNEFYLYQLDNSTPVDATGYGNFSAGSNTSYASMLKIDNHQIGDAGDDSETFISSWALEVGKSTDAVDINDFGLHNICGHGTQTDAFQVNSTQISAQTTNKPTSRFTISRSFTNNTGSSITVNEIGIYSMFQGEFGSNKVHHLMSGLARDVLSSGLSVPDTKTLTVEYEVIIELDPDTQSTSTDGTNGGLLDNFLANLRSQANTTNNTIEKAKNFCLGAPPANNIDDVDANTVGWHRGIRVGTNNEFTSMTDSGCLSLINHGEADGELFYYGSNVEPDVEIDNVNNKAIITINRIFENRGSVDVTIGEVALRGNTDTYRNGFNSEILARTALESADQYTVNPGDFVQVTYKIEIVA